jgi:hypothetical protein
MGYYASVMMLTSKWGRCGPQSYLQGLLVWRVATYFDLVMTLHLHRGSREKWFTACGFSVLGTKYLKQGEE